MNVEVSQRRFHSVAGFELPLEDFGPEMVHERPTGSCYGGFAIDVSSLLNGMLLLPP